MCVKLRAMIAYKIIMWDGDEYTMDGERERTEVYISVAQTQSLFDCLVDKTGDPENWTELCVCMNGVHALGWRVYAPSGRWYPVCNLKPRLDEHFRHVCMKGDAATKEIHLSVRRP